jgi:hypothetical protein
MTDQICTPFQERRLLLRCREGVQWEEGQAAQLVKMCKGERLALTLVGGLIAAGSCTPKVCCCL